MNSEQESDIKSEIASLKFTLANCNDPKRREEIKKEIAELEEMLYGDTER